MDVFTWVGEALWVFRREFEPELLAIGVDVDALGEVFVGINAFAEREERTLWAR